MLMDPLNFDLGYILAFLYLYACRCWEFFLFSGFVLESENSDCMVLRILLVVYCKVHGCLKNVEDWYFPSVVSNILLNKDVMFFLLKKTNKKLGNSASIARGFDL